MDKGGKKPLIVVIIASLALAATASLAWACTPAPKMLGIGVGFGPRQSPVTVTGETVVPGERVVIRWNTLTGPTLGEASADKSGSFSVSIRIPGSAPEGIHYITMTSESGGVARAAFEVVPGVVPSEGAAVSSPAASGSSDLWEGYGPSESSSSGGSVIPSGDAPRPLVAGIALSLFGTMAIGGLVIVATNRRRRDSQRLF